MNVAALYHKASWEQMVLWVKEGSIFFFFFFFEKMFEIALRFFKCLTQMCLNYLNGFCVISISQYAMIGWWALTVLVFQRDEYHVYILWIIHIGASSSQQSNFSIKATKVFILFYQIIILTKENESLGYQWSAIEFPY